MDYCPRTDLACEAGEKLSSIEGTEYSVELCEPCVIERLDILTADAEQRLGKRRGRYITVSTPRIEYLEREDKADVARVISLELRNLLERATDKTISESFSVLAVGLGNPSITADAIGPFTADRITATAHLIEQAPQLFDALGMCSLSVSIPGVIGKTGIETAETVISAAETVRPDAVVIIDALAARSTERLARTFQLSDTGITPGAGVGNARSELSQNRLGIPVISIGVPTVVDSSTLVFDLLSEAKKTPDDKIKEAIENMKPYFVTPKETDVIVDSAAEILASAIDSALVISRPSPA